MKNRYGLSINEVSEDVFACGLFSSVEYSTTRLDKNTYDVVLRDAQKLNDYSRKYNVKIASFHLPFSHNSYYKIDPASLDDKVRNQTFVYTKRLIDIYSTCNPEYVVIHGSTRVEDKSRAKHLDAFAQYLKMLCSYCAKYDMNVAVETLKPRCIANGKDELLYIMNKANCSNVGICFDSNHLLNEDNLDFLRAAGEFVIATHFSDFDGIDECHWYPGRGINNWIEIIDILDKKGYKGYYTFEVSWPDDNPCIDEYNTLISEWEKCLIKG